MNRKPSTASPGARRQPLQRLLTLFGLAALIGSPAAFAAGRPAGTEALGARVAQVRDALQRQAVELDAGSSARDDAAPQWANWPNWGNWNNWPNWGNWFNHR